MAANDENISKSAWKSPRETPGGRFLEMSLRSTMSAVTSGRGAPSLHRQLSHYAAKIVLSQWYQAWNFFKDAYVYTQTGENVTEARRSYLVFARQMARRKARDIAFLFYDGVVIGLLVTGMPAWVIGFLLTREDLRPATLAVGIGAVLAWVQFAVSLPYPRIATVALDGVIDTLAVVVGYSLLPADTFASVDGIFKAMRGARGCVAYGLLSFGVMAAILFAALIAALAVASLQQRRALMRLPITGAIYNLLRVRLLVSSPQSFRVTGNRRKAIAALDRAARLIRLGIPRSVELPNPVQRSVFDERCRKAAASLEVMELWIALPKADTPEQLSRAIDQMTAVLLSGNYDDLPQVELPPITGTQRLRQIGQFARTLLIGAVPGLVLLGLKRMGIEVGGDLGGAVIVFCIGWASVTYLSMLDPLMPQRLSMIRDLLATIKTGTDRK